MPDEGYESPKPATYFDLPDDEYYDLKMERRLAKIPSRTPTPEESGKPTKPINRTTKASAKLKKDTKTETGTRRGKKRRKAGAEGQEKEESDGSDETEEGKALATAY